MIQFFKQILKKIQQFDEYTSQYLKITNNIEMPSLAYTNWGMYFANIKDFNTAIEKLETAVLMSGQNPKPCISLGVIYAKIKNYEKAEYTLKEAIRRDSQNAYAYLILGCVYIAVDRFEEAEDSLKKALKLTPSDSEIYLNYGIFYAKQQKKHKAIEMFKKAKQLNPMNTHASFLLGVMLFETNQISEAFFEFKNLEKLKPDYKNLNYYLALCYKKEKNYNAVLEYARRALEDDSENPSIYILLAQNYISMNKADEAVKILEKGNEKNIDDFEFFLSWGITLLRLSRIEEAKEKLNKALEKNNNSSIALYRLGVCFYKEKNYDKAKELFERAISIDSKNTQAIADLGIILYEEKVYEKAIQIFLNAIEISSQKAYLYFYVANCYYKLGKFKKSLYYYDKTVEYYPNHLEALINYTVNLLTVGNTKEAMRKIRNAYQLNRKSEKVLLVYALTGFKSGLYSDAIEKTDMLLSEYPENQDAKLIKLHALINLNKPQEALNIIHSFNETEKNTPLILYLSYLAYKILVEQAPSNYNENMLNFYLNKLNEIDVEDFDKKGINAYISKTLNINKG